MAFLLLFLIPATIYLFYPTSSQDDDSEETLPLRIASSSGGPADLQESYQGDASLVAEVEILQEMKRISLKNTGSVQLHHVEVLDGPRSLAVLSMLSPSERKVLATRGPADNISVKALDPSGRVVSGSVSYNIQSSYAPGGTSEEVSLSTKAALEQMPPAAPEEREDASPLSLNITLNRSEGYEGDVIGYRCAAVNTGSFELSDVRIFCSGRMASTKFLPPGREVHLDGSLQIQESGEIHAGAQGLDPQGRIFTNNTSAPVWRISPKIRMKVDAPSRVHRGERFVLSAEIENIGGENLTEIRVSDSLGDVGGIPILPPGANQTLQAERMIMESRADDVRAIARDSAGREVYASSSLDLRVLNSSLRLLAEPEVTCSYGGVPAEVTWILSNTGEEDLKNIALTGEGSRCTLRELPAGRSVRMAAIYVKNSTSTINVTVRGYDSLGYEASAEARALIKVVRPGISLKVMPAEIEVAPGDTAVLSCLVTNSGEDVLSDVILGLNGSSLATIGRLEPGEFRVVEARTLIPSSCTLKLSAEGRDSLGGMLRDSCDVRARASAFGLRIFVSASPPAVVAGSSTTLRCTVANSGSVPLYSIFIISKEFGPLGTIDYLAPKRQKVVTAERAVDRSVEDVITAEGFTQDKSPVKAASSLTIGLLKVPVDGRAATSDPPSTVSTRIADAKISRGNVSIPLALPAESETKSQVSRAVASSIERNAVGSRNMVLDGIAELLRYVERLLGRAGGDSEAYSAGTLQEEEEYEGISASRNYELSITGVRSSEHGAIRILDVSATPSSPAAGEPVKITAHINSESGIRSASVRYGLSDAPLTRQEMMGVDRIYELPLELESGNDRDGYWSATIPGREAGVYMVLSLWMMDGGETAEDGPYMLHWSTVGPAPRSSRPAALSVDGMLFIESSSVKGQGEVSIKDTFQGEAMHYNEKILGNGSISLESMRFIDRKTAVDNFTEVKDLVFTGGQLRGHQTVESPRFHGGLGASVTERFNLSHVDRSEVSSISSASLDNNTLAYRTEQAFDGTWNIQTKYAKFSKKIKADQQYTGSFQTEKSIKFQDAEQGR